MKKRILIVCCLAFLFGWSGHAQTLKQYKKAAKKAFKNQEYGEALNFLNEIQKIDSSRFDQYYLQAEAARYYNAFELAEQSYLEVLKSETASKYPKAIFGLATVQKMQGKYDAAIGGFERYIQENPDTNQVLFKDAKQQIQACLWAKELIKVEDKDLIINQLGANVNTDFSDFAPTPYKDKLLFSSLRFIPEKNRKQGNNAKKYSKILAFEEETFNTSPFDLGLRDEELHAAHIAFNKAQDKMYFNICQYELGNIIQCKIYSRTKINDTLWSKPQILPEPINSKDATSTQPNIGYDEKADKEFLSFISDRVGGKGGKDIWFTYLEADGSYGNLTNLRDINTEKDEFSPFFHNHTQTLFFSSNGRKSLGGHDIYKVVLKDRKWQMVDHTGFPLNSSYNDVYFSLNELGSEGYLASNREGTRFLEKQISACCYDIFKAEFNSYLLDLEVLTFLRDGAKEEAMSGVEVKLFEIFDETEKEVPSKKVTIGNKHFYRINSNKKYRVIGEKVDHFPGTLTFDTESLKEEALLTKKIYLKPLRLNILTFTDEPPKAPLSDVNITLIEVDEKGNTKEIEPLFDPIENSHFYPLKSNRGYEIRANKDGYDDVMDRFDTKRWRSNTATLKKELILPREEETIVLQNLNPFPLYFDNDFPNPGSIDTLTNLTFPETLKAYKSKKDIFKKGYTVGLNSEDKQIAEQEVETFFETEIDSTFGEFLEFTDAILQRLNLGRGVTISVQAYASPLASDSYNLKLTKRRISSMLNFYRSYKDGAMKKYVDAGKLNIELVSHGESKAPANISDNPNDRRNSVFGLAASKQRKVEIVEVRSNKNRNKRGS